MAWKDLSNMGKASVVAGVGAGFADIGLGIYNINQGIKNSKAGQKALAEAMSSRPDLSASTAFADAERQAYSKKMLNMQRQSLQRNLASGVQAASADPRVLAASLTGMQRSAAMGEQQAMQAQAEQQMQATVRRGMAEQQATQLKERRSQSDIDMYREDISAARQAIGQGIGQVASGIGNVGSSLATGGVFKEGGAVKKTPGQFSHDKNPIDIVQKGDKIGEMTGGEYIFNPKQVQKIKGHVAKGDKNQLHKYMKSLISKFEK